MQGETNIYEPIEAYSEEWVHVSLNESDGIKRNHPDYGKFVSAMPKPDTKRRNDLPPIYLQWREDYRKRNV